MPTGSNFIGKHPHNWKGGRTVTEHGYVLIFVGKDHPIADVRGYAYEHRLKAWQAGHDIEGKQVHHEDEIRDHNDDDNLKPLTPAEHRLEHRQPNSSLRLPNEPNSLIFCACGCRTSFLKFDDEGRPRQYVSGHNDQPSPTLDAIRSALGDSQKRRSEIVSATGLTMTAVAVALTRLRQRNEVRQVRRGVWEKTC